MELHGADQRLWTYFNASYINSLVKTRQQLGPTFIATAAPKFNGNITETVDSGKTASACPSVSNFWQMVWENQVNMIVMLCELENESKEECIAYWDQLYQNSRHAVVVDKIEPEKTPVPGIIHRVIHLKKRATKLSGSGFMIVDHYQMTTWKDDCAIAASSE